jgi:hypothetical protein
MSGTHTSETCAGDSTCLVPPAEFIRLRYFFGQRLNVVDLADEQAYHAGKQRFHNLLLHGAGVLCGLRAVRYVYPQGTSPSQPTTLLRVRRGAALDACGREIVVGYDQCIDVAAWLAQHPKALPVLSPGSATPTMLPLWVALCYRECPSDSAPAPRDPCGCDASGCEFARIREGFELKLLTEAEAKLMAPEQPSGANPVAETELGGAFDLAYLRLAAQRAGADCPMPSAETCLLLARFEAVLNTAGTGITDITAPDNAIPERSSLLSTARLQEELLRVLAAAGDAGVLGSGPRLGGVAFEDGGPNSGNLTVEILPEEGIALSRDPFAAPAQISASVFRFKDDGEWEAAPAFTAVYAVGPPRLELQWLGGSGLVAGRYRVLLGCDRQQPPVDQAMRPLTPPVWARHFRLEADSAGNLVLADSLYP